jgi:single stranded DNA-binding protein (ssb)
MVTISGVGRLGKEPTMKFSDKGNAITNMSVAVTSGFGDKEETTWLSLVAYGKQAEILNQYLSKGSRLVFTAEFSKVRTFEKSDKSTGVSVDAKILTFSFVDKANVSSEPEVF